MSRLSVSPPHNASIHRCRRATMSSWRSIALIYDDACTRVHVFVQAFVVDPFPDLRLAGCELLVSFNARMPDLMKHFAVGFVKALRTGLDHRHSRVRIGTLAAVSSCVMCEDRAKRKGAGSAGIHDLVAFQDPNSVSVSAFYRIDAKVNYFAKLSIDGNVTVRCPGKSRVLCWRLPHRRPL